MGKKNKQNNNLLLTNRNSINGFMGAEQAQNPVEFVAAWGRDMELRLVLGLSS